MTKNRGLFFRIVDLYYDGFRQMTVGKTLWAVILIKLFMIFVVLKLFFFPDFLSMKATDGDKAAVVADELVIRGSGGAAADGGEQRIN